MGQASRHACHLCTDYRERLAIERSWWQPYQWYGKGRRLLSNQMGLYYTRNTIDSKPKYVLLVGLNFTWSYPLLSSMADWKWL